MDRSPSPSPRMNLIAEDFPAKVARHRGSPKKSPSLRSPAKRGVKKGDVTRHGSDRSTVGRMSKISEEKENSSASYSSTVHGSRFNQPAIDTDRYTSSKQSTT
mmetsp:Transcript_22422/g.27611  ORF Transcript_22422/g.27611 Transcript_22422/m.27611 type:complete len:103 (+) Transcript_22422:1770-2078(+)